jgi:hypothetical protein
MYRLARCSHCTHQYHIDVMKLAQQASRWACPVCAGITDFAEAQIQQPSTSLEDKQIWAVIGVTALIVGVAMFANRAEWQG